MDKKGQVHRFTPLVGPWVKHLAACSQGLDLTTYLIAPDGVARIRPVDTAAARKHMEEILCHCSQGLCRPLPVTARAALAYLFAQVTVDPEEAETKAKETAKRAYEGDGFTHSGELGYGDGVYLRRCYPSFDALWNSGDNEFKDLATKLYAPIIEAAGGKAIKKTAPDAVFDELAKKVKPFKGLKFAKLGDEGGGKKEEGKK